MKHGEVWWASLPAPTGSAKSSAVQSKAFNDSRIATVIMAVITSNPALAAALGNVRVAKAEAGLSKASVVNVSQLITLDRSLLTSKVKSLPGKVMAQVDEGLRLVLALQ